MNLFWKVTRSLFIVAAGFFGGYFTAAMLVVLLGLFLPPMTYDQGYAIGNAMAWMGQIGGLVLGIVLAYKYWNHDEEMEKTSSGRRRKNNNV